LGECDKSRVENLLTTENKIAFDKIYKSLVASGINKEWLSKYNRLEAKFMTSGSIYKVGLKLSEEIL